MYLLRRKTYSLLQSRNYNPISFYLEDTTHMYDYEKTKMGIG